MRPRHLALLPALAPLIFLAPLPAAAQDFSKVEVRVERLAPGVAVLFGEGGNIGVSYGADGNVLIDDQYAPLTGKILAAVRTLDPAPLRFVINTHFHWDHTGGNENLGKVGAVIVAHDNVRKRMSVDGFSRRFDKALPASPKVALPVVTFPGEASLHLNGQQIHMVHVARAHSDGDTLVHWPQADVLHMGDTFFHKVTLPFIDLEAGGSIDGLIAAVRAGLALAGPNTRIIPGHGPLATRADLEAYLAMLVEVRGKVFDARAAGRTLAQIKAANPAARHAVRGGFIGPADFVELVYSSLPPAAPR